MMTEDQTITIRRPHVVQPAGQPPVDPDAADGLFLLTAAGLLRGANLFAPHGTAVVVQLLEDAADAILNADPEPENPTVGPAAELADAITSGDFPELGDYVQVVTRYGGHRHLAEKSRGLREHDTLASPRYLTMCRSTSSWTLESWEAYPDHPQGLRVDQMAELPACPQCLTLVPL